ncbi:MAG: UDP-N-acetylmuramoyl-L-alanyl-D-glutamate--2,6-diaminopimelate ligase [Chlamydiota bacterium]|nr:UDP-N-acetylmuramoyl-L-alanyl-D-glutamate--2,6-diaminopimelate ligase [Chlamydiota bacterium]
MSMPIPSNDLHTPLQSLIEGLPIQRVGRGNPLIQGISSDSRQVVPGDLFIAKPGRLVDGEHYIAAALHAGAVAILSRRPHPLFPNIPHLITPNIFEVEAQILSRYYRDPSDHLRLVGITGTNGKSTTAHLLAHFLGVEKGQCGLMGTLGHRIGTGRRLAPLTTPNAITLHRYLHEMVRLGCAHAVMEVSSHALTQKRMNGTRCSGAIFTNLSHDHLDYHGSMLAYGKAKRRLFQEHLAPGGYLLINGDDPTFSSWDWGNSLSVIHFGQDAPADIWGKVKGDEIEVMLHGKRMSLPFPLMGEHNASNLLGAIGAGYEEGLTLEEMGESLVHFRGVPGRLESVRDGKGPSVFIDFAHTPDALQAVLRACRNYASLILVMGCGGERDRKKRPEMGAIAHQHAHHVIFTSDNPRREEPQAIIDEILKGVPSLENHRVIVERPRAIQEAIWQAKEEDVVLIVGKGHEGHQIIGDQEIPCDDREIAKRALSIW